MFLGNQGQVGKAGTWQIVSIPQLFFVLFYFKYVVPMSRFPPNFHESARDWYQPKACKPGFISLVDMLGGKSQKKISVPNKKKKKMFTYKLIQSCGEFHVSLFSRIRVKSVIKIADHFVNTHHGTVPFDLIPY